MYVDETLICVDCGREFVFSSGEQRFYEQKGFQNKPNRCPDCRQARKAMRASNPGAGGGTAWALGARVRCSRRRAVSRRRCRGSVQSTRRQARLLPRLFPSTPEF